MTPSLTRLLQTNVVAIVILSTALAATAVGPPTPTSFHFILTLEGSAQPIFVRTFELGEDAQGPTLTVSAGFTLSLDGLGGLQVGQRFDAATLQIVDETGQGIARYRLSSVRVRAVRGAGESAAIIQEVVFSGKAVTFSSP
jgi:hypothetical protein